MERPLESYEQHLIQATIELEHLGLQSEQAWEDAVKIKSSIRKMIAQQVE